jgi:6-phosphofructokinase 1
MEPNIKNIAVLTSGGDAPGMNAAIRAVVRTGIYHGINMFGVMQGYQGLITDNIKPMDARSVSNILHLGGTILKTARCLEFKTDEGQQIAYNNLKKNDIDGLVVIGGDGTFTGAKRFSETFGVKVIGIPGTIDRLFFIEVMGRDSGCIALRSSIASGAEAVLLPEKETSVNELINKLALGAATKKSSSIVIVAEGHKQGGAYDIAKKVKETFDHYDTKVTILGHLQRGGSPSSFDRILGSRLGFAAVNALIAGETEQMVGLKGNEIKLTSIREALTAHSFKLEPDLMEMTEVLSI